VSWYKHWYKRSRVRSGRFRPLSTGPVIERQRWQRVHRTGYVEQLWIAGIPKANQKAGRRCQHRAFSGDELRRVLHMARPRPLAEHRRETVKLPPEKRNGRRTWTKGPLTFDTIDVAAERAREGSGVR